jgi:ABC-type cobalamin/Fe3+-siderophores transport system ATPase subunit
MLESIRLFDYRCFRREAPATLHLTAGFTAFVGANNAGKSALIRSVYELRTAIAYIQSQTPANLTALVANPFGFQLSAPMYDAAEIVCERSDPQCAVELTASPWGPEVELEIRRVKLVFSENASQFSVKFYGSDDRDLGVGNTPTQLASADAVSIGTADGRRYDFRSVMRLVSAITQAQFVGPFRNALNEGAGGHFDTQIGTGFVSQWNTWKTGPTRAHNRAIERVTEDIRRLIGANTLEITASSDAKTLQVTFDRRPHKLQELGSGMAQLIVVLGNALIRPSSFIVIDEPEVHLHPGLQLEFLTTLAKYATFGVIFATHSIGLARSAADFCFSVQKTGAGAIVRPFERTPHYAEFLGSLGIAGLQEIGWDRILLVEGPKDVRTFQQLLRLYGKDRKTVVLPLGGDSLINGTVASELSEIVRLGGRIGAVVDSERRSATDQPLKARRDFAAICSALGIACCVTERRAIENYMSPSAISQAFAGHCNALSEYDSPGDAGPFWGKGESWRAAQLMTKEEIEPTDIGRFLFEF